DARRGRRLPRGAATRAPGVHVGLGSRGGKRRRDGRHLGVQRGRTWAHRSGADARGLHRSGAGGPARAGLDGAAAAARGPRGGGTWGGDDEMTRETIQGYFDRLSRKAGWESFLADDMTFTSYTSPVKRVEGKTAYLEATKRFYSTVTRVEVRHLLVDGDRACA